ncbi:MAG TPA: hypothetical protein PLR60_07470 [Syntrophorhabdaceae bacterium]|nr:hypothetical protein [Syntrophorhabdaceae bacterium]
MKVSKPILILCIALLFLAGYIHFFTGKKKPKGPVPPTPPAQTQTQPAPAQPPPAAAAPAQAPAQQAPAKPGEVPPQPAQQSKPQFDKLKVGWASDPFALPKIKEGRKKDSGSAVRLVAILEKDGSRVAVIDKDVVKKGDMIGNEKVIEIGRDRVVLSRSGAKRTLVLADVDTVSTEEALTTKQKGTERAK